jgi:hypothetical protein
MNDHDELNDGAVLSAVRDSISGLPMPTAPRLEAIKARGRARRLRRVGGLSVAAAGACAALVVGLTGGAPAARPAMQAGPGPAHHASAVHLVAFTVAAGPDGTTTLTLYPGQVADPNAVRQALAEHGIPALVTAGEFCRTAVQPAPGVGDVVQFSPGPAQIQMPANGQPAARPGPISIYGSRIPSGVELSIGYRQDSQENEISFALIVANAPLTCSSIPDHGPHGND